MVSQTENRDRNFRVEDVQEGVIWHDINQWPLHALDGMAWPGLNSQKFTAVYRTLHGKLFPMPYGN